MTTMHKTATISEREDRKPKMILDYNNTKGGVDTLDQVFATLYCLLLIIVIVIVIIIIIVIATGNLFAVLNSI